MSFEIELRSLINRYSIENGSNTPDYILADYLNECLCSFNRATNRRTNHSNCSCNLNKETKNE